MANWLFRSIGDFKFGNSLTARDVFNRHMSRLTDGCEHLLELQLTSVNEIKDLKVTVNFTSLRTCVSVMCVISVQVRHVQNVHGGNNLITRMLMHHACLKRSEINSKYLWRAACKAIIFTCNTNSACSRICVACSHKFCMQRLVYQYRPTNYMGVAESDIGVNIKGGATNLNGLNTCLLCEMLT